MTLRLIREPTVDGATLGCLFIDGAFFGFTCEDAVRERPGVPVETWKIPGATAIPAGKYRVVLSQSQRFKRLLPEVLHVPGFLGVRIHRGNGPSDTEGCPLVGTGRTMGKVTGSAVAETRLMELLKDQTNVWLVVENPPLEG